MYKIYVDGSCKGNGKKNAIGGWCFLILDENDKFVKSVCSNQLNTTNNRMEMIAVIEALGMVEDLELDGDIEIYTDSSYIHSCLSQKWYVNWQNNGWVNSSKQPVKNKDLWLQLIPYFENEKYSFHKVKGHAGHKFNEYVDTYAQKAAEELKKELKEDQPWLR